MASNGLKCIIQVANIPWTVSRHELALYFSQFGYVYDAMIKFDKQTGLHQNHGYVTFLKRQEINTVLDRKHSLEGKDLILTTKYSTNGNGVFNGV